MSDEEKQRGMVIIGGDYSAIELRVLQELLRRRHQDPVLIREPLPPLPPPPFDPTIASRPLLGVSSGIHPPFSAVYRRQQGRFIYHPRGTKNKKGSR